MKSLLGWFFCGLALWSRADQEMVTSNETKLSALREILASSCPGASSLTCDTESTETSTGSCCIKCSCDRSCGLQGNCCYEQDDIYQLEKAGSLRCMSPGTKDKTRYLNMYKFVVGPPVGGCVAAGSCNSLEEFIPLKTFYPVFSRSRMMNYVSEECSHCHGVTDGIKWDITISFISQPTTDLLLEIMFNHTSERAYLVFVHPGNHSENLQGICSDRVYSNCRSHRNTHDEVRVDLGKEFAHLDVRTGDLKNGCLHGPNIPYLHTDIIYKNLFCRLCRLTVPKIESCISSMLKTTGKVFSTFIDTRDLHEIANNIDLSKTRGINPIACKIRNRSSCRPVLCPTMQLRSKNGDCKFLSRRWQHPRPSIILNLTTSSSSYMGSLSNNVSKSKLLDTFYKNSPWHKCWRLQNLGWRSYQQYDRNVTEFVLHMVCNVYETDPFKLMNSVQQSLSKEWIIHTDEGILSLHQELHSTTLVVSGQKNGHHWQFFTPSWYKYRLDIQCTNVKDALFNLFAQAPYWEILLYTITDHKLTFLNLQKHFFCSQIQIHEEEYDVLQTPPLSIKYIPLQKILFFGEITGPQETKRGVKICVEDSEFEIVKNGADVNEFTIDMDVHAAVLLYLYFFFLK